MVLASFFIASISMLALLVALRLFNRATYERGRKAMLRELSSYLDDVTSAEPDRILGSWMGMPVSIELSLHAIDYRVTLPLLTVPRKRAAMASCA